MAKMGRPPKEIKKEQFEALCEIQCTQEEICSVLGVTTKTLQKWCRNTYGGTFSQVFQQKRLKGKASLRHHQWKMSKENVTMAIFLGKQFLGQSDSPIVNNTETPDDGFIKALSATAADDWAEEEG